MKTVLEQFKEDKANSRRLEKLLGLKKVVLMAVLNENTSVEYTDLKEFLNETDGALYSRLSELKRIGCIDERQKEVQGRTKKKKVAVYFLTNQGKADLEKCLNQISEFLENRYWNGEINKIKKNDKPTKPEHKTTLENNYTE